MSKPIPGKAEITVDPEKQPIGSPKKASDCCKQERASDRQSKDDLDELTPRQQVLLLHVLE